MPQKLKQTHKLTIKECEWCKESHSFPIDIILEKEIEAIGMRKTQTKSVDIVLTCPNTGKNIIVTVPINIGPFEELIEVHV